mgnify:CR=1 FL=1
MMRSLWNNLHVNNAKLPFDGNFVWHSILRFADNVSFKIVSIRLCCLPALQSPEHF